MGWWRQSEEGYSFALDSELVWGDGPADVLDALIREAKEQGTSVPEIKQYWHSLIQPGSAPIPEPQKTLFETALNDVRSEFKRDWQREPQQKELMAGFQFSYQMEE